MIDLKEIKNKILKKENFYFLIVILITFFIDRYSKIKIMNNFNDNAYFVNDFINLDLIWNTGIGFGLFASESTLIYNIISTLISLVILILIYTAIEADKFEKISFSIIIGGALGNLYDRISLKAVPDFIDLHYNDFHWFTFNLADIFITLGILAFLTKGLFVKIK